ncbi:MAG: lasso peptide biosynthesis B2 protein [Acaryochloridaceae cyanobacterium SU_2_1]|nr:lasso peptide biosynthesis B2 protein [Acaryochloridaceae cyanobacterium SU_2_1]
MKPLLKFIGLSQRERHFLLKTYLLLGLIRLGLWLLPFQTLQAWLAKLQHKPGLYQAPKLTKISSRSVGKAIWAVNVSSRYMPGKVKCLARALATQVLICRQGYQPELKIGVAKAADHSLEAHAWIELQGQVIMGLVHDLSRFTPMPSLDSKSR